MIQLTKRGVILQPAPGWIEGLQKDFAEHQCILLPRLIDTDIMQFIYVQMGNARFLPREYKGIGLETYLPSDASVSTLHFIMNSPEFLRLVERVTSCGPIGLFWGRIYRMEPTEGHYTSWHDDVIEGDPRLLALSLNLSPEAFAGGELELRDEKSKQLFCRIANTGFGDAIIFRIAATLEHRVEPVRGTIPKTAYAGWFRPYKANLHGLLRSQIPIDTGGVPRAD